MAVLYFLIPFDRFLLGFVFKSVYGFDWGWAVWFINGRIGLEYAKEEEGLGMKGEAGKRKYRTSLRLEGRRQFSEQENITFSKPA
jgi:hypothetical protein